MIQDMGAFGFDAEAGAPPDVIGAAAAWLCTAPEAREMNGQWIEGQNLTARPRPAARVGRTLGRQRARRATAWTRSAQPRNRHRVGVAATAPTRSTIWKLALALRGPGVLLSNACSCPRCPIRST